MLVDYDPLFLNCERLDRGIYAPGGMFKYNLHILIEPIQVKYGGVGTTHLDPWGLELDDPDYARAIDSYGTADNMLQIREHLRPFIDDPERTYVVEVDRIIRAEQPETGGFRPHKWGPYLGTGDVEDHEYFVHSNVQLLYHFHIYEVKIPDTVDA